MRPGRLLAVIATIPVLMAIPAATVPAAAATDLVQFQTPSRNIGCLYYKEGSAAASLRCDIVQSDVRAPRRPAGCDLDYGNAFAMTERGRAGRICAGDTAAGAGPIVAYGKTWRRGGFTCSSLTTGLTCRNRANHGWTLSRTAQKLF